MPWLLLIPVGLLVFSLMRQKNAASTLDYRISGLKLKFTGITNPLEIQSVLSINNPSNDSINFNSFAGFLKYGSNNISTISIPGPIALPAQKTSQIPVQARIPISRLLGSLASLVQVVTQNRPLKEALREPLQITGVLTVGALQIPVNETIYRP